MNCSNYVCVSAGDFAYDFHTVGCDLQFMAIANLIGFSGYVLLY